jgi:hypothetical protein
MAHVSVEVQPRQFVGVQLVVVVVEHEIEVTDPATVVTKENPDLHKLQVKFAPD